MQAIDTPPFYGGTSELSHETKPNMVTMSGLITDETTGQTFEAAPFPPFIQKIITAGGLLNSLKEN